MTDLPDYDDPKLTPQEEWLVRCAAKGKWWGSTDEPGNPVSPDPWDTSRVLRASVIRALAAGDFWTTRLAPWPVHRKGLRVEGAWIWGQLDLEGATVERTLWLHNSTFEMAAMLRDAKTKTISLQGSRVSGLYAARSTIEGDFYLRDGFSAQGEVNLTGTTIEGQCSCVKGSFANPGGTALNCQALAVGESVLFRDGFSAKGEVNLMGATIRGQFSCIKGSFDNPGGKALNCNGLAVGASVLLRDGFSAKGEVNLLRATIEGQLSCIKGSFDNPGGRALNCEALTVGANVLLRDGFSAKGEVNFSGAKIGSNMICVRATFDHASGDALDLTLAQIGAGLFIHDLTPSDGNGPGMNGRLLLSQAKCRTYHDDKLSRPEKGKLMLDGFSYERFDDSPTDWKSRNAWLKLQRKEHIDASFRPQPWTQTINVLRAMGHDGDARRLAICRENARLWAKSTGWLTKIRMMFSYVTVGYGYRPWQALVWSLVFVLFGWWVFASAASLGYMAPRDGGVRRSDEWNNPAKVHLAQPTLPRTYPPFNGLIYALDGYLPVIEFGQDEAWEPSAVKSVPVIHSSPDWTEATYFPPAPESFFAHGWHRVVYWANEILGWLFITLFIAGMSGLMKKE